MIGRNYTEPTKIAIRSNRSIAALRSLIHVAPLGAAVWEITLNWNTYFVGTTMRNLAWYQFGAKIHELTAQASLAAIVLFYVRYQMLLGQGLPFGALFSGLHVAQGSYLWSMEFWGSLCSNEVPLRRRLTIATLILLIITLAATVGPSSAILLTTRLAYWPAGSTDVWLNGTFQDLWPERFEIAFKSARPYTDIIYSTDGSRVPSRCLVLDRNPSADQVECPAAEWQVIQRRFALTLRVVPDEDSGYLGSISPTYLPVTGQQSQRSLIIQRQTPPNSSMYYDSLTPMATS